EYDLALRLIAKANAMSPQKVSAQRIRQIKMDRDLEEAFATFETRHFLLRYPESAGDEFPRDLGRVLEAERERLRKWIPVTGQEEKIEIHLFELEKFMEAYSGGVSVLGIYDGKVRVPLADLQSFHPLLVNIVSHEVAHAMVDQVTGGKTPKWFNEGLASHIEMDQKALNPIPDMHKAGRYLSFAIMEPVLAGFSEPQLVELAYIHSTWALHFIESRYGVKAIHRMLHAFGDGLDTEAALGRVLDTDIAGFDEKFKAWSIDEAPALWPTKLVRYDRNFDGYIERKQPAKIARYAQPNSRAREAEAAGAKRPKLSLSKEPAKPAAKPKVDPQAEALKAWHRGYARATQPIKVALGETLAIYNGKTDGDLAASCSRLSRSLGVLREKPETLAAPSKAVRAALGQAYGQIDRAARACQRQDRKQMGDHLDAATEALGRAYGGLKAYGLKP
ncbi:MAG: hypothetical protein AAFY88_20680, partial [Acidobacteriota bacterium]